MNLGRLHALQVMPVAPHSCQLLFDVERVLAAAVASQSCSLQIGHDGRGMGADWQLEQVAIKDAITSELAIFPCKQWLGGEMGGGDATAEVLLTCVGQAGNVTAYQIYVFTSDKFGAGTDSKVKIRLYGTVRDSGWLSLHSSMTHSDKFERNNEDQFLVRSTLLVRNPECLGFNASTWEHWGAKVCTLCRQIEVPFLGSIKRCTIAHDGWGLGAGWHLDRIKVVNLVDEGEYDFPCDRWLDNGSGDRQLMRDLIQRKKGVQHVVPGLSLGKASHLTKYKIVVFTGQVKGAGTDANVTVVLYGDHGRSGPWRLDTRMHDDFERAQIDTFYVEAAFLGELKAIKIGHDGAGGSSSWYLETVVVRDELNGGEWEFECRAWLVNLFVRTPLPPAVERPVDRRLRRRVPSCL